MNRKIFGVSIFVIIAVVAAYCLGSKYPIMYMKKAM